MVEEYRKGKGRPKGRRYFKYRTYLTPEQIEWLKSQKVFCSASSLIRTLLNNYMHWKLNQLKTKILGSHPDKEKQKLEYEITLLEKCLEK